VSRYRTIVADPPWHYEEFAANKGGRYADGTSVRAVRKLPYTALTLDAIKALPVVEMAARDARLFLWTTNRYLRDAFDVLAAWGFDYRQTLVWHKTGNPSPYITHIAPNHAEFILVGARGKPSRTTHLPVQRARNRHEPGETEALAETRGVARPHRDGQPRSLSRTLRPPSPVRLGLLGRRVTRHGGVCRMTFNS
jgi:N6-adenosine-specific RNA methylase IME4